MPSQLFKNNKYQAVATNLPQRHKIIIGIDYGTTNSGVSFATSIVKDIKDVVCISEWPSRPNNSSNKTPTRIAYPEENNGLSSNKWGYQVKPNLLSCSWTKLLLDKNALAGDDDDDVHSFKVDEGLMHLPPFRNASKVCEDFLREIYEHSIADIKRSIGAVAFEMTPMDCWVTLPAIWSDEAKDATLNAAKLAGFGKRPMDQIHTIAEPEAAAIATLKELAAADTINAVQHGENILICDCGGGTVDITTYKITSVIPKLTFEELCIGMGGKCGSTYIDRRLHVLLSERFGRKFDDIPYSKKGPGSQLMINWECFKQDFGHNKDQSETFDLGPLNFGSQDSKYYDSDGRTAILSHQDMQTLFDPIIGGVISLVQKQVEYAHDHKRAKINRIVLVGGLGSSKYLYNELSKWCSSHENIQLLCPMDPYTAVLRGAAIRGLEELAPRVKYARCHYGFRVGLAFRQGIDNEAHAYINEFSNEKFCNARLIWVLSKGDEIVEGLFRSNSCTLSYTPGEKTISSIELYSCTANSQPERSDDPRSEEVGQIRSVFEPGFNFGIHSETRFNHRLNKMVHRFHFEVQVVLGNRGANLTFRTAVGGRLISNTTIDFPDH